MELGEQFNYLLETIRHAKELCPVTGTALNDLAIAIENLKLIDLTQNHYNSMRHELNDIINVNLQKRVGRDAKKIVKVYIDRITSSDYGFQGGFGHTVRFVEAHNWVIHVEYYDICLPTNIEKLAMLIEGGPSIDKKPSMQHWGN
jgi:hypothetical protein